MNRHKITYIVISLASIIIGCTMGSVMPMQKILAQPATGAWRCYAMDRMDKGPEHAADWGTAKEFTAGLNQVARHTSAGTVLNWGAMSALLCVKY